MKKITFCGCDWTIIEAPADHLRRMGGGDECFGVTSFREQTIYIDGDLPPYTKGVTLAHELCHVLLDYIGYSTNDEDEESLVRQLEHHLYSLVKVFPEEYK